MTHSEDFHGDFISKTGGEGYYTLVKMSK